MKRKTSSVPTRIWSFHAEPPIVGADMVRETLFAAHQYQNKLVEIEREHRQKYDRVRAEHSEEVRAAAQAVQEADEVCLRTADQIKKWREEVYRTTGRKTRKTPEDLAKMLDAAKKIRAGAKDTLKVARASFKASVKLPTDELKRRRKERGEGKGPRIRERINAETFAEMMAEDWPQVWKDIQVLNEGRVTAIKAARAECGVLDGTYNLVEKAVEAAVKAARPGVPNFRRFDGRGRIGVQLKDVTVGQVMAGQSNHLRLRHEAWDKKGPEKEYRGTKRDQLWIAAIRVDSDSRGRPVWAEFPVRLHRTPPADAVIKWAWVRVVRHGTRLRYQFQLTLESKEFEKAKRPAGTGEARAIFFSRAAPSGVQVADVNGYAIVLPRRTVDRLQFQDKLRSRADLHYDDLRRVLSALGMIPRRYRGNQGARMRRELCRSLVKWATHEFGGHGELRRAWARWRQERLGWQKRTGNRSSKLRAKRDLFCSLPEASRWARTMSWSAGQRLSFWCYLWVEKDKHLRQYAEDIRERAECERDAFYRREAIRLATQYETLVTDDTRLSEQKRKPGTEVESDEFRRLREIRHHVAPGRCREIMREVFGSRHRIERLGDAPAPGTARGSYGRPDQEERGKVDGDAEAAE